MQQARNWPEALKAKFEYATFLWGCNCLLVQPCHIISFIAEPQQANAATSQLAVARLQRLVTAASRITMQQRMQLVFQGYKARFAEVGVCSQGLCCLTVVLTVLN